jgi:hypothetical protein
VLNETVDQMADAVPLPAYGVLGREGLPWG